jgi:nucleoside-diphosphate-sugar epimerase
MKVFVTGCGGYIGVTLIKELTQHGHQVVGLGRSDNSAEAIKNVGGEVQRGSIEDVDLLKKCAQASDGVIHLAFMIDDFDFAKALAVDRGAINAMAEGLGSGKPLVVTSGSLFLPKGQISTEDTSPEQDNIFGERAISEELVKSLSKEMGVRGSVVRLSPVVHCHEDKFFVPWLIESAKKEKFVTLNGDNTRWPAVHRSDTVALFRLALEKGVAGSIYHAIAEQGVPVKDITETIGKHLNVPVKSMSFEEAQKVIPFMAIVQTRDCAASSEWTQKELGWNPTGPGLIADMEANYFS